MAWDHLPYEARNPRLRRPDLWGASESFLPKEPPKLKGGRPRVPDRAALAGIVFVLKTGIPWQMLSTELSYGSGSTCWRRLRDWEEAGVWAKLHERVLHWLGDQAAIDWGRANVDSLSARAQKGDEQVGPNPVERGTPGSKYHVVVDRTGVPLAVRLSAANAHLLPPIDAIPPIMGPRGKPGRPRKRPAKLHGDKADDAATLRRALRARGITPCLARRGIESSTRLGRYRWVVERSLAWLLSFRRLDVRYERRLDLLQGLLHLACALVCLRFLAPDDGT